MQKLDFVPLHVHTEYSLLDGAIKIEELIKKAVEYQMSAVAITDHGNLFGAVEFYKKAINFGIKPIIGCEVYIAPESRFNRKTLPSGEKAYHLVLLAKDMDGYKNLMILSSKGYIEGFYYKPRIDIELLSQYSKGLIGLSACMHGEIPYYISIGDIKKAKEVALKYKEIFGSENFYLELQDNGIKEQDEINRRLYEISIALGIDIVATNDCHYLKREDARAHDILLCIQTGKTVNRKDRLRFETDQLYFKSPQKMWQAFKEIPEALLNTIKIAEKCNIKLNLGKVMLPKFVLPQGINAEEELERIAIKGLKEKIGNSPPDKYIKRLSYELNVIKRMGFAPYFLIVWDFINFARKNGIPVGPGRGSAAGSLVAYSLDITEIDPIRYNLLFERFLNPDRITMPDIDVDFCKDRRNEVIKYVSNKYGTDHVAHIITFGTMAARASVRDVGRALDIPYSEVDRIAKLIPGGTRVTIEEAIKTEPKLKEVYQNNPKIKELIDIAKRLEGLCRHASTHAAGIVISPTPLTNYTPLYKNPTENIITTQFDMKSVELIGLLKFDFLGLKTLTVIEETLRYLKESGKSINLKKIPLDDPKTYELLATGKTTGVFQLESVGMRELLVKLQPSRFEDLIALVALYRPGPLGSGMVEEFIQRKKGLTKVNYEIPQLKDILDETYGVILYQEQVMRIANELAGFSMAQADVLRKAMGKKQKEKIAELEEEFIKGAIKKGIEESKAKKLFELMSFFGEYGFNKSHSAAYAYLAYQTAYLKAHYPVEFMAANLSKEDSTDKIVMFINECKQMGIQILPPDINLSDSKFKVMGNSIRFGLDAVKGIGIAAVSEILKARKYGHYRSIKDFLNRVDAKKVNRKVVENLVKAGAFDSIIKETKTNVKKGPLYLLRALAMKELYELTDKKSNLSLFSQNFSSKCDEFQKHWNEDKMLSAEKESIGFYITGHPIDKYKKYFIAVGINKTSLIQEMADSSEVTVAGIVTHLKKKQTKTKDFMAVFIIEDDEGFLECIVFPDIYNAKADIILKNNLLIVKGTIDKSEKGIKLIVKDILTLKEAFYNRRYKVEMLLNKDTLKDEKLTKLKAIFSENIGNSPVYIRLRINGYENLIITEENIIPKVEVIERIESIIGKGRVRLSV